MQYTKEEWFKLMQICDSEGTTAAEASIFSSIDTVAIKERLNALIATWKPGTGPFSSHMHEVYTALHLTIFEKTLSDMPLLINNPVHSIRAVAMWRLTIGR